ncbi:MAG TPA: ATP-binding protein [Rhizomicrobium sp.]|nr:ATP-binding protein [Rhizomicrobium sp.]
MPLSFKPFSQIQLDDLNRLQTDGVPEGLRIDYKRDNYGPSDAREFLKDVSSFANSHGGYLLIGVDEENGIIAAIPGIPDQNIDADIQRLENLLRDGIEPRIVGYQVRRISVSDVSSVIAIAIPRSLNPPHRVSSQGTNRFFLRNSSGKHEASVEELRHLFGFSARLAEDIRNFIGARRREIVSGDSQNPDRGDGRLIVHVINAASFSDISFVNIKKLYDDPYRFAAQYQGGISRRASLEGIVVGHEVDGQFYDRTLIFRDGSFETVHTEFNRVLDGEILVPGTHLVQCLVTSVESALKGLHDWGATGPYVIGAAVETIKGARVAFSNDPFLHYPKFDRAFVELPSVTLLEYESSVLVPCTLRPMLNALWNSVGLPECTFFKGDKWQPPSSYR